LAPELRWTQITEVNLARRPFEVKAYNQTYLAESLIIATGASPVHLNIPGEQEYTGYGSFVLRHL